MSDRKTKKIRVVLSRGEVLSIAHSMRVTIEHSHEMEPEDRKNMIVDLMKVHQTIAEAIEDDDLVKEFDQIIERGVQKHEKIAHAILARSIIDRGGPKN